MSYNEFFTDSDKPYAENLNDSLLLLDAFDVTVPIEMPGMFSNGEFSSTTNVARKCGVGIVTLKSVASGVTVGTSSIGGTGEVVFRIYPNFNSFYKWYKLILTKTGTVSVAFKKTDGTTISTSIGSDGVISEVTALKQLQEIDLVLTLTSATITGIHIDFVNNQTTRTRTGALLEASQLTDVNGTITNGETKAVSGGTVYTALNTKENSSNKVTTLDNSDSHYPSCSAVKTVTDGKANSSHTHSTSDVTGLINLIYPVGSIYMSIASTDPSTLFGGTWVRIKDTFLLACGDTYASDGEVSTAQHGEATHSLTSSEMPRHTHVQNSHGHGMQHTHSHHHSMSPFSSGAGTKEAYVQSGNRTQSAKTTSTDSTASSKSTTDGTTAVNKYTGGTGSNESASDGAAHNNMPPYMAVYAWKRTA